MTKNSLTTRATNRPHTGVAAAFVFATASLGACTGSDSDTPQSTNQESRAADTSSNIMRVSGYLSATPIVSGASFEGLDEAEDILADLEYGLADADCADYELDTTGAAVVHFEGCVLDGDLDIDGTMTVDYDVVADCTALTCEVDATVSVDTEFELDGIVVIGSWSSNVNQDGDGSFRGSFSASAEDFSMNLDMSASFGAGSCSVRVDYTDSNGNLADLDITC